jgi:hypothetical protein
MAQRRLSREEIERYIGQRVTLQLAPDAPGAPTARGQLVGTLDAADGLVVFLEPEGQSGRRVSYHAHYVVGIAPA